MRVPRPARSPRHVPVCSSLGPPWSVPVGVEIVEALSSLFYLLPAVYLLHVERHGKVASMRFTLYSISDGPYVDGLEVDEQVLLIEVVIHVVQRFAYFFFVLIVGFDGLLNEPVDVLELLIVL